MSEQLLRVEVDRHVQKEGATFDVTSSIYLEKSAHLNISNNMNSLTFLGLEKVPNMLHPQFANSSRVCR